MKQNYIGKIVYPGKFLTFGEDRNFISFTLYVKNHLTTKEKERKDAKINCLYRVPKNAEKDMIGVILSRVHNKSEPDEGGLAGQQYNTVDLLVEGDEKLTEVGENAPGAVYKNLENCFITVLNQDIKNLYWQEFGTNSEEGTGTQTKTVQERPNRAPKQTAPQEEAEAESTEKQWDVGDTIEHEGKTYEFTGGDSSKMDNWREVVAQEETSLPPFMAGKGKKTTEKKTQPVVNKTKTNSSLQQLLESDSKPEDEDFRFSRRDDIPTN